MTITSTINSSETTGATASTSYNFNYPIHKAGDLRVYVDAVRYQDNDTTYGHTITVASNKQSATVAFSTPSSVDGKALKFERVELKPIEDPFNLWLIMFSKPAKAPPQINKILVVSTC